MGDPIAKYAACPKVITAKLLKPVSNSDHYPKQWSATKEWWYSNAVTQERRDKILQESGHL